MNNFNLLPQSRTYQELLVPFFVPYALYTGLGLLAKVNVPEWQIQLIKLVVVSIALVFFRKNYGFGKFHVKDILISLIATPVLLAVWIYPLSYCVSLSGATDLQRLGDLHNAEVYFYLRLVNSVILVALFEELLCRVYLFEYFFQAGKNQHIQSFVDRLLSPLDTKPVSLELVPFSLYSIVGSTVFFTVGHSTCSYISAILYFSITNVLYWKTRSLWTCILAHGMTNLGVALLVKYKAMDFLWF